VGIAALPDPIAATLTPDTLLTDPRTDRQVPLKDLERQRLSICACAWMPGR
jgi:hypothetical protein